MTRLLVKGADGRSAFEVAERLESVGASVEPYCSHDSFGLDAQCAAEDWLLAFEFSPTASSRPTWPKASSSTSAHWPLPNCAAPTTTNSL
jgi:hypothetical protein